MNEIIIRYVNDKLIEKKKSGEGYERITNVVLGNGGCSFKYGD